MGMLYYGSGGETSWSPPTDLIATANAECDWTSVNTWKANTENACEVIKSADVVEVDDWDAGTVEIWDSLSARDNEQYGKQIASWKAMCSELRETRWLVDRGSLSRRRSL